MQCPKKQKQKNIETNNYLTRNRECAHAPRISSRSPYPLVPLFDVLFYHTNIIWYRNLVKKHERQKLTNRGVKTKWTSFLRANLWGYHKTCYWTHKAKQQNVFSIFECPFSFFELFFSQKFGIFLIFLSTLSCFN
jgi:hypothetical protein